MKAAVKKRWIRALRSGEYKQGTSRLHWKDGDMCCLGLLYDIEFDGDWELRGNLLWEVDGRTATLSIDFRIRVGLSLSEECTLTVMNDNGRNFQEIADYIEEYL